MTLDLRVLFQMGEHDDERDSFLVDHAPEILNSRLERALRRDEQLIVSRDARVDEVRVDIRIANVFVSLNETHTRMLDYITQF